MTQNWRNLFHPGLAPLQVLSNLKLNRSRLLISLVRSRPTRQLDMTVWAPKPSNLSHHHLSIHFAGYWTYQLQPIPSLINGKSAKLHHCTKVVSNVKKNNYCRQCYLKSTLLQNIFKRTICYMNYNQLSVLVIRLKRLLSESWTKFCLKWIMMKSRD